MDDSKLHIRTPIAEVLVPKRDCHPAKWLHFPATGLRQYVLRMQPETGASIALLDFSEGLGVPEKHTQGEYEYANSKILLRPGDFYMNPKDYAHGPTNATKRSILEAYDGRNYHEAPQYHTK